MRKSLDEEFRLRNYQSLMYEDLCVYSNVKLPPGYKLPKFNTFSREGDFVAHLKDYYNRLVGIGYNKAIQMRLLI